MSVVVKTVCGWVKGFILCYGIYIILYGHLTPGGGFAGGVIAASAFVLVILAEGYQVADASFSRKRAAGFSSLGGLLFWLSAMLGLAVSGVFFISFWDHFIELCEAGIGLLVCSAIYLVMTALQTTHASATADQKGEKP
jgi:multicomponent Na+:H+ antiporter subunit B